MAPQNSLKPKNWIGPAIFLLYGIGLIYGAIVTIPTCRSSGLTLLFRTGHAVICGASIAVLIGGCLCLACAILAIIPTRDRKE